MGDAGRAWVDGHWRWDILAERMGELLRPAG
jgi:phosphatidylinositol alpha-1,6-mannosyltransferase